MIRYQDFIPKMVTPPALFTPPTYEEFDVALEAANRWIKENEIRVVTMETVVLPNIWSRWEEGTSDPALGVSGEMHSEWHQIIRVWYQVG